MSVGVIDAHHHFLDPERIDYPFVRFLPMLDRFLGPEDLEPHLRAAGVDRTVCVQAADCEVETRFMMEQAARVDWVAGVVGWLPLLDPEATGKALERYAGAPVRLCGARHLIHDEPDDDWLLQDAVVESLGLLAQAGLSFDVSAFRIGHLRLVSELAESVPELPLVVCHFGMPKLHEHEWEPWAGAFAEAARHPGCFVKVSGLDMTAGGCDAERFRPYFDHALGHFGPSRMIWASNWPVSLQLEGYGELLDTARALLAGLPEGEREAVFGGNAARVYRLPER